MYMDDKCQPGFEICFRSYQGNNSYDFLNLALPPCHRLVAAPLEIYHLSNSEFFEWTTHANYQNSLFLKEDFSVISI